MIDCSNVGFIIYLWLCYILTISQIQFTNGFSPRGLTLNRHIIHLIEADIAANEAREKFKVLMSELKQRPYAPPSPNSPSTADLLHELRDERSGEL